MSAHEAVADFIRFMETEGMKPAEPIAQRLTSGDLIRFRCAGDGRGRDNGWAILFLDERPAGRFGNHRLQIDRKWRLGEDQRTLTAAEREALQREWAEAKAKRQDEKQRSENEAALEVADIWSAGQPANPAHPYAQKKRLDVVTLRQAGEKLLIPMVDAAGKLWNLQRIGPDGTKRFLRGGRTDGLFTIIGEFTARGQKACIGEGYATCAAVHRASGYPCIVAFSAKNMAGVARLWNAARPDLDFIICADDDSGNPNGNVGLNAARAVAEDIGAKVAVPAAPIGEAA